MTKLVFITQQVDPRHPALASHGAEVSARSPGSSTRSWCWPTAPSRESFPRTVASARSGRAAKRYAAPASRRPLTRELSGLRGGAVVAHMCPIYAVLAAPLVRPLRIPLVLWFTHWRKSGC